MSQAPQLLPTKTGTTPIQSPKRSPVKRTNGITAAQKQALIDNLQLELTERARKLRAQYAIQAQGLRMRLEMRVNRLPKEMRKMTVGEVLEKCAEKDAIKKAASPVKTASRVPQPRSSPVKALAVGSNLSKGTKRTRQAQTIRIAVARLFLTLSYSSVFDDEAEAERENATAPAALNPKKRARVAPPASIPVPNASHNPTTSTILSPRSVNPRPLPVPSPTKYPVSPLKPLGARPMSPTKPSSTILSTAASRAKLSAQGPSSVTATKLKPAPSSRPGSRQAPTRVKRDAAAAPVSDDAVASNPRHSIDSDAASSSAGTIVVTNVKGRGAQAMTASAAAKEKKTGTVGKTTAAAARVKKTLATKMEVGIDAGEATVKGGRTLRKRG